LPSSTLLRESFDMVARPDMGSLYESEIDLENSWEYSSLILSPDITVNIYERRFRKKLVD
jgi:hypothetical protein